MGDRSLVILKIDIDTKVPRKLLNEWIETRRVILQYLGYNVRNIIITETTHGYHAWIYIEDHVDSKRKAELQFLLDDDHRRAQLNLMRAELNAFDEFNALFSKKIKKKVSLLKVLKIWIKVKVKAFSNLVTSKLRK